MTYRQMTVRKEGIFILGSLGIGGTRWLTGINM